MKSTEFCYWLQGFFEISGAIRPSDPHGSLTSEQVNMIKAHLNMVFIHEIDPSYPKEQQEALNTAHDGSKWTLNTPPLDVPKMRC